MRTLVPLIVFVVMEATTIAGMVYVLMRLGVYAYSPEGK